MRVIAGALRGKKLIVPQNELATRPTADRARESLFNILNSLFLKQGQKWEDIIFADVFSGTGAVGIEALSRGAKEVSFFETDRIALKALQQNISGMKDVSLCGDALHPPKHEAISILFMDAPYGKGLWQEALIQFNRMGWIDKQTLIIIETDKKMKEICPDGYCLEQERSAGRNTFLLMRKE